jgi:hypothetical protein
MDRYVEANGDSMSPAGRALLGIGSFGARFGAYRNLVRGGAGTIATGAERAFGTPMPRARDFINRGMGGILSPGSLVQRGAVGALKGVGGFAFKFPFRTAIGAGQAGVAVPKAFGRLFTGGSVSGALDVPVLGSRKLFNNKFGRWMFNKDLDAPLGHGVFALAGLAGFATSYGAARGAQEAPYGASRLRADMRGRPDDMGPIDPNRFPQGIYPMPRRGARNDYYGPALTLQLHHSNSRVMP